MTRLPALALLLVLLVLAAPASATGYVNTRACTAEGSVPVCHLTSDNFTVNYVPGGTTDQFANWILMSLERAHEVIFDDWGYDKPAFMRVSRLGVYIRAISGTELGVAASVGGKYGWITIATEQRFLESVANVSSGALVDRQAQNTALLHLARATAGHELFHVVQQNYLGIGIGTSRLAWRGGEVRWFAEATASWAEQHIYEPDEADRVHYGYFSRNVGAEHWRIPVSNSDGLRPYQASSFFQYLTENHASGDDLIKTMLETLHGHAVPNVWDAIAASLGDTGTSRTNLERYLADFAAAALIQLPAHHETYSLDQLRPGMGYVNAPGFDPGDRRYFEGSRAYVPFTSQAVDHIAGREVTPLERSVSDLAFDHVELLPFTSQASGELSFGGPADQRAPVDIDVAVAGSGDDWIFRLVEIPLDENDNALPNWTVRTFELDSDGASEPLRVTDFGRRKRVVVIAANLRRNDGGAAGQQRTWRLAASVVEPLVVSALVIRDASNGLERLWAAERSVAEGGAWSAPRAVVTTGIRQAPGARISVLVELNRAAESLSLRLGGITIPVERKGLGADAGRFFVGELAVDELAIMQSGDGSGPVQLPIEIEAADARGAGLDTDPATVPKLLMYGDEAELLRWDVTGAGNPGGTDTLAGLTVPLTRLEVPPYLMGVRVYQQRDGARVAVYDAQWRQVGNLSIRRLDVAAMAGYDPGQPASLELEFSRPMDERSIEAALEMVTVAMRHDPDRAHALRNERHAAGQSLTAAVEGTGYVYTGTIPATPELGELLASRSELVFAIAGRSESGQVIDHDPASQAYYDWGAKGWSGYAPDELIDRNHRLTAGGTSYVLLLDASRSMADGSRFADAKAGLLAALQAMKPGDQAALVVFYDCATIRLEQAFTTDRVGLWDKVKAIETGAGTPLGDAVAFARGYMEANATYPERKLLVFSDGASNCGRQSVVPPQTTQTPRSPAPPEDTAGEVAAEDPMPEPDEPSVVWWAYRIETTGRPYRPVVDIVELHYEEATGDRPWASLNTTRYLVSTASTGGRTLWSIGWSSGEHEDSLRADGDEVAALRTRAEGLRSGAVERAALDRAVSAVFGAAAGRLAP